MTSTTTCDYAKSYVIDGGGVPVRTTAPNQNFAFGSSTCVTVTSSDSLTYGDMVISLFLLLLLMITFFSAILDRVIGVKQKPNLYGSK